MKKILLLAILLILFPIKALAAPNAQTGILKIGDIYLLDNTGANQTKTYTNASYDKSTNTLTLNGINTTDKIYAENMGTDFKIKVVGNNKVVCMDIFGTTDLTITGTGTLTTNSTKEDAIYIEGNLKISDITIYAKNIGLSSGTETGYPGIWSQKSITINNATINMEDIKWSGITADETMTITKSDINMTDVKGSGIYAENKVVIKESNLNFENIDEDAIYSLENIEISDTKIDAKSIGLSSGTKTGYPGIWSEKNLAINNTTINMEDMKWTGITADETISITTSELNFENIDLQAIISSGNIEISDTKIDAKSIGLSSGTETGYPGIYSGKNLTINNTTINMEDMKWMGITASETMTITKSDVNMTDAKNIGIYAINKVVIKESNLNFENIDQIAIYSPENIEISDTKIDAKSIGLSSGTETGYSGIYSKKTLTINNTTINMEDMKWNGIKANETMTITKSDINMTDVKGLGIYAENKVVIKESNLNFENIDENAIYSPENIEISDTKIDAKSIGLSSGTETGYSGIYSKKNLAINNTTINMEDMKWIGIDTSETMTITKSELKFKNVYRSAILSIGDMEISDTTIDAKSISLSSRTETGHSGIYSGKNLAINNATINMEDIKWYAIYANEKLTTIKSELNFKNVDRSAILSIGDMEISDTTIDAKSISLSSGTETGHSGIYSQKTLTINNATINMEDIKWRGIEGIGRIIFKNATINIINAVYGLYISDEIEIDNSNINIESTKGAILIRRKTNDYNLVLNNVVVRFPNNKDGIIKTTERTIDNEKYYFSSYALGDLSYNEETASYNNIVKNISIFAKKEYKILKENIKYTLGSKKNIEIEIEGENPKISFISINDKILKADEDYTTEKTKKGVKIILSKSYLSKLEIGEYKIKIKLEAGEVEAKLSIVEKNNPIKDIKDKIIENPKTSIRIGFIGIIIVLIVGLTAYKYNKNNKAII